MGFFLHLGLAMKNLILFSNDALPFAFYTESFHLGDLQGTHGELLNIPQFGDGDLYVLFQVIALFVGWLLLV